MTCQLSIVIVSFNTRDLTLRCLQSVFAQTEGLAYEVIVVDNCSSDGSADAIAAAFPDVKLIRASRNLGFAAANNLAAAGALGDWLLLLNPDTLVLAGAIPRLHACAAANPQASIFGGRTLFADGSLNPASCWGRPKPWSAFCVATGLTGLFPGSSLFNPEGYGGWRRDTVRYVDIISGCFLMLPTALWRQLGGFDPAFFMYGEEADLCLRACALGHQCMTCPDATIIHHGGASERVRADKMVRLFAAKALLFRRHWRPGSQWFGIVCLDLWSLSRLIALFAWSRVQRRRGEAYQTWRRIWQRRAEWHSARIGRPPVPAVNTVAA